MAKNKKTIGCGSSRASSGWKAELEKTLRLIPGYDPFATAGDSYLDHDAAKRAIDFFPECIKHVEGEMAGKPFALEPWEAAMSGNLFGWKRPDGTRRYRKSYIQLSRGNGKSAWGAGTCLYGLVGLGEYGAQINCAAGTRDQAGYIFRPAKAMAQIDEFFEQLGVRTVNNAILWEDRNSAVKAISADADTNHGANVFLQFVDELHIVDWDFWRVICSGLGKRRSPLLICTTTAGWDRTSVCYQQYQYACQVRDGIVNDPAFLPVIYETKPEDDWREESTWRKANPNLGVSVMVDYMKEKAAEAVQLPSEENTFRMWHLGQWTEQAVRWIPMEKWDACEVEFDKESLAGRECYAGLDLSAISDLTALSLAFPEPDGKYKFLSYFWCPKNTAVSRSKRDRVKYDDWIRGGWINATEGDTVDYDAVVAVINELSKKFIIKKVAVDRLFQGVSVCTELMGLGYAVESFGQGFYSMAGPAKSFEEWIVGKKLEQDGNPVTRWMVSNAAVEIDAAGNKKPSKKHSTEKIDIVPAMLMAIGLATSDVAPEVEFRVF